MVQHIEFTKPSDYFSSYHDEKGNVLKLTELSQINFFVGANNSGKSRLLRGLAREFCSYHDKLHRKEGFRKDDFLIGLLEVKRSIVLEVIRKNLEVIGARLSGVDGNEFYKTVMPDQPVYNEHDLVNIFQKLDTRVRNDLMDTIEHVTDSDQETHALLDKERKAIEVYFKSLMPYPGTQKFKVTYVPAVRSLRSLYEAVGKDDWTAWHSLSYGNVKKVSAGSLQLRTLLDYFIEDSGRANPAGKAEYDVNIDINAIFTGERLYEQILALRTGKESQRTKLSGFENFLSKSFFNGQKVEINSISDERGEDVHIKIGGENEFPVYALGDGIQAVILLTFPLFFNQGEQRQIVFYEEPELLLHPGMQRIFIDVLRQFPEVQSFIATHSNHLLDTSLDHPEAISIYAFEKKLRSGKTSFSVRGMNSPTLSLLNLLGVRNSSVFLSNCTVWVEGISDRLYIRRYLELYMEEMGQFYKEDLHFSFLEFGGNNIVHYDFSDEQEEPIAAKKITSRIFLVHDSDKDKQGRHDLLFHQLGENYHQLPVLEIENLLSQNTLEQTLRDLQKTTPKLEFKTLPAASYTQLPLAALIAEMVVSGKLPALFSTPKQGRQSRLYDKAGFARAAIANLNKWNDLSEPAQALTRAIFTFIQKNNKA
jgi:hypothetical protein